MFKEGDVVWAKISGYPWWPSYIDKQIKLDTYKVLFLGEISHQILTKDKIKDWAQNYKDIVDKIKQNKRTMKFFASVELGNNIKAGVITIDEHNLFISNCCSHNKQISEEELKEFIEYYKKRKEYNGIITIYKKQLGNLFDIVIYKKQLTEDLFGNQIEVEISNIDIEKKRRKLKSKGNSDNNNTDDTNHSKGSTVSTEKKEKKHLNFTKELIDIGKERQKVDDSLNVIYSTLKKLDCIKDICPHLAFNSKIKGSMQVKQEVLLLLEFISSVYQVPFEISSSLNSLLVQFKNIDINYKK